jgi:hypothetical protein
MFSRLASADERGSTTLRSGRGCIVVHGIAPVFIRLPPSINWRRSAFLAQTVRLGSNWPLPAGWRSAAYEGAAAGFERRAISLADPFLPSQVRSLAFR